MLFVGIDPADLQNHYCLAGLDEHKKIQVLTSEKLKGILAFLGGTSQACVGINLVHRFEHRQPRARASAFRRTPSGREPGGDQQEPCQPGSTRSGRSLGAKGRLLVDSLEGLGFDPVSTAGAVKRYFFSKPDSTFEQLISGVLLPINSEAAIWQRQLILMDQDIPVPDIMQYLEEITRFRIMQGSLPGEMVYTCPELNAVTLAWLAWLEHFQPDAVRIHAETLLTYTGSSADLKEESLPDLGGNA